MNADSLAAVSPQTPQSKQRRHDGRSGWAAARAVMGGPCIGVLVFATTVAGMRLGIQGVVVPDMLSVVLTQLLLVNVALGLALGAVVAWLQGRYRLSPPVGTVAVIVIIAFVASFGTVASFCTPSATGEVDGHEVSRRMLQATVAVYGVALLLILIAGIIKQRSETPPHEARTTEPRNAADSR
jgi:fatty acid desaturase